MNSKHLDSSQIRRHFSAHADDYDRYARVQKLVATRLVELALDGASPEAALDIGTGTGAVAARLRERSPASQLTVSDLAHEMTATAALKLPGSFAVDADAHLLPFKEGTFDLVVSASVYQWVEDLESAFLESYRILKPGGRFAFALFADGTLNELEDVYRRALQKHSPGRPMHFQTFPHDGTVCQALGNAGFCDIESELRHETESHDSFRDLLVGLKKIGAQNASTNRPTGLFPRRVLVEMDRLYRHHYASDDGVYATYSILYGVGRKV